MGLSNSLGESLESKTLGNIMALIFLQICPNRQREGWQMPFRAASIPFQNRVAPPCVLQNHRKEFHGTLPLPHGAFELNLGSI